MSRMRQGKKLKWIYVAKKENEEITTIKIKSRLHMRGSPSLFQHPPDAIRLESPPPGIAFVASVKPLLVFRQGTASPIK